jgi:hypothetical protein
MHEHDGVLSNDIQLSDILKEQCPSTGTVTQTGVLSQMIVVRGRQMKTGSDEPAGKTSTGPVETRPVLCLRAYSP